MRKLVLAALLAMAPGGAALAETAGQLGAGIEARAVSFASPSGHRVTGQLTGMTATSSLRPGVLFIHWLGDPATTNHTQFERDAVALAERGATSLLIDAMWSKKGWFGAFGKSKDRDVRETERQIQDVRAALDFLLGQPGIDPKRIALVGHDFGAMFGILAAHDDARVRHHVLMTPTATLAEWYLLANKNADRDSYIATLGKFDIPAALKAARADDYLFQFSARDEYVPVATAAALFEAAPLPKGVFYYDVDHSLNVPAAHRDRQAWLMDKLFGK